MVRIGDAFLLVGGGTPSTAIESYWGAGTPWFSSADINSSGKITFRRRVTDDGINNSTTNIVSKNTVVVVTRVGLGKVAKLKENMCFSQDIQALIPKNGIEIDADYLCYQMRFHMQSMKYKGQGTTISGITKKQLSDVEILLPNYTEQRRIVARIEELFSELDNGVETLRKTKQQLAVYRQAVLKAAFDTNQNGMVELSEIVDDIRIGPFGTMLHKTDYVTEGIPVVNPQHIKGNAIIAGEKATISKEKATELSAYELRRNDIVMGRRGEMGRCAAVTQKEEGWICGTGSILFRLKPEFDAAFYAQLLSSPTVVRYLEENATGTTMKNLNEEIVRHIPVPLVTRQQQAAISGKIDNSLSVCDNIEATVDASLQLAEAMRQSILKQVFEGRLV